MTGVDLLVIVGYAAAIAAGVGIVAAVGLRRFAGASIIVHLVTIVLAAVLAIAGGTALAAQAMYLSPHDVQVSFAIVITCGVISSIMAVVLGRSLSGAAGELRGAARRLGTGEPLADRRVAVAEFDEVHAELVASSERLARARSELERAERARRELVTRIAHDLLAPLAGLRAQAEALEDGLAPDPDRYLRQMSAQVARVSSLVDDLFEVSRIDAGAVRLRLETVSLGDLASDVVAEYRELAGRHGIGLALSTSGDLTSFLDSRQMTRALANLVVNALQHTPPGGTVRVDVAGGDSVRIVDVVDEGPGIPVEQRELVFEPGWRGDAARSSPALGASGGAGLGLAIARGIVEAHGGVLSVEPVERGARLRVELPAPEERAPRSAQRTP